MKEIFPGPRLWTPENDREEHFEVPSVAQLEEYWRMQSGDTRESLCLPTHVYGFCLEPNAQPSAIVALDLCEVLRETAVSLAQIRGGALPI